jgi:superfamily II RNA helicase
MNTLIPLQDHAGKYAESGRLILKRYQGLLKEKKVFMKRQHVLNQLSLYLRDNEMLPCIVFVFSRKQVERCAEEVTVPLLEDDSKVPYVVKKECDQILMRLPNYKEYMNLPEYHQLVSLLEKGIGIHHSGMIPILREIVELMISKRYIKMLFATESFAIGLDCPIKTAVFSSVTKYDGSEERYLLPHEYTQMAGRAGRRGIDTVGYVVHCNNLFPLLPSNQYETLMSGVPQKLVSKYKITYNLILNLLQSGQQDEFSNFSKNAMIYDRIANKISNNEADIEEVMSDINKCEKQLELLKTPQDICERYINLEKTLPYMKNKQRKAGEREKTQLLTEHKGLENDIISVRKMVDKQHKHKCLMEQHHNLTTYIGSQTEKVCDIMEKREFIVKDEEGKYNLTEKGIVSTHIAEVHPLIMGEIIVEANYFKENTIQEIICYLSIFSDIKVKEENKLYVAPNNRLIKETSEKYDLYDSIEGMMGCNTGMEYTNVLSYDLYEYMEDWMLCEDEYQCKELIQKVKEEKEISMGDFNKALLKISNISREITSMAKEKGHTELENKLSRVDGMILKYIATAQSLYV